MYLFDSWDIFLNRTSSNYSELGSIHKLGNNIFGGKRKYGIKEMLWSIAWEGLGGEWILLFNILTIQPYRKSID